MSATGSLLPLGVMVDYLLDEAVGRWHETCPNEERSLAEWLGVTDESFASWVMSCEATDLVPRSQFLLRGLHAPGGRPMSGHGIPRASRPFESPMTLAVRNSRVTVAPDTSLRPARADEAEADPPEAVAADPSVIDAERHPLYRDGVERNLPIVNYGADPHKTWTKGVAAAGARQTEKERVRQSRLSRWQEQR